MKNVGAPQALGSVGVLYVLFNSKIEIGFRDITVQSSLVCKSQTRVPAAAALDVVIMNDCPGRLVSYPPLIYFCATFFATGMGVSIPNVFQFLIKF